MHITKTAYKVKQNGVNVLVIDNPKTKNSTRVIPLPKQLMDVLKKIKKANHMSDYKIAVNELFSLNLKQF